MQMDGFNRGSPMGHGEFSQMQSHLFTPASQRPDSLPGPAPPPARLLALPLPPSAFLPLRDLRFLLPPPCLPPLPPPHSAPASLTQGPKGLLELPSLASIAWIVSPELPAPSRVTRRPAIAVRGPFVPCPCPAAPLATSAHRSSSFIHSHFTESLPSSP